VALDESSRTSAALVKIIFREFLNLEPEWVTSAPDLHSMMQQADAALIIGDPAMTISHEQFRVFDLATLWHEFTGCGFVFAMWMVRSESVQKVSSIDFAAARDEGLANLDQLIASYPHRIPFSADEMRQYLIENIVFKVDEEMRKGLTLYFELAQKNKLITLANPIAFISS
jgi:chorismate dehydratase